MPGVEVHANIARTLLDGKFIVRVDRLVLVLLLLAFSAGMAALLSRIEPLWGLSVLLGTSVLYAWVVLELFVRSRLWVDLVAPVAGLSFTYVGVVVYRFLMEQREKRMIKGAFAHYVPKSVVDELLKNPQLLSLGGEERELSVLFSDVQSFTSLSERMSPSEIRALLDEYLTPMTEVILGHEGIIDKYEGDAIMAEFGAPLPLPDHARKACFAALDMQAKLAELRERWSQEGKPLLYMRVGVGTGRMVLGNMGSREIFDYTVIGDSVNTASRLEGANKEYGTRILISEATYLAARDHIVVRELDRIRVKGKREPVRAYELLGRGE
ncbi:MAG TPA: adenylate/guanylate cyclase domain-containing protein, partial [Candidatus Latescibacteria bacterium]|nr:adenylate/guanylate cyclase domain-containing protein [Candidatus Latescibacterota bacterium]